MLDRFFRPACVGFVLSCAVSTSTWAQPAANPPPGCRAWDADLPQEWQAWADMPAAMVAASNPSDIPMSAVNVGKKMSVALAPSNTVHLQLDAPDIDPPPNAHSGMLLLHVPVDGRYWIATSGGVWIDAVVDGAFLNTSELDGGPLCASIGKAIQFRLKAGDVLLQFTDNRGPHLDLMVVPQP